MKLERGYIYRIRYKQYKHDPFPLVLVLYSDSDKTHCLNFNYLSDRLTARLITLITDVATKRVSGDNAYSFYHRHLKKILPGVVRVAYRTYFTNKMTHAKKVTEGFYQTSGFLSRLKRFYSNQEYAEIRSKIRSAIKKSNDPETEVTRVKRMFRLFKPNERLSPKQLEARVRLYLEHINDIKIKNPKIDWSAFTFVK